LTFSSSQATTLLLMKCSFPTATFSVCNDSQSVQKIIHIHTYGASIWDTKCVSFFSTTFVENVFHFDKYLVNSTRDMCRNTCRSSCKVSITAVKI
jgi:hypothetical protein